MSNLQKYEPWTPKMIQEDAEDLASESEFLKFAVGITTIRIMPKRIGSIARGPLVKVWQHYIEVPGLTSAISFACPRLNGANRPCPACQRSDRLRATGNPVDYELGQAMRASKRVFCNAINRATPDRGPIIAAFGKTIHEALLALANNPKWGDFTDPGPDGYDVEITRRGTGKNDTKYTAGGAREAGPLHDDATVADAWLDMMHDLDRFLRVPTDEELVRILAPLGGMGGGGGPRRPAQRRAVDTIDAEPED